MSERCRDCPVPEGYLCASATHPRYCHLAATDPNYRPVILKRSGFADDRTPPVPPGTLVLSGHANSSSGYGRHTAAIARSLVSLGVPLVFHAADRDEEFVPLDPFLASRLVDRLPDRPVLHMLDPHHKVPPGSIVATVWETSRLPADSVANLNRASCVVVPCRWNAEGFRESGVTPPIRVVPEGIDTAVYYPTIPEPADEFIVKACFRASGGGHRKGYADVIAAFIEALGDRPDCRLVLKMFPDCPVREPDHPRVVLDRTVYDDAGLARWYAGASVGFSMSKAEGWGLTLLEQLACGRPMVAPIHSGMAEYLTPGNCYPVEYANGPATGPPYDGHGDWYLPDRDSAVRQLRRAYANPDLRRIKGRAAANDAAKFEWKRAGRGMLAVLEEFGLLPTKAKVERPAVRPQVANEIRLAQLRGKCPNGTKPPGCGCQDTLLCSNRDDKAMSRQECYACLTERG